MQSLDAAMLWRAFSVLVLAWLAWFFGRTLRAGSVPLIERIARISEPQMPESLSRYTRRLTAVWVGYFIAAALATLISGSSGAWVWIGTAILFVGERAVRPLFFPGRSFPGLLQQLRDTWSVWHPGKHTRG